MTSVRAGLDVLVGRFFDGARVVIGAASATLSVEN
jgi:hypothetical protein